jgi:hypothetical protein
VGIRLHDPAGLAVPVHASFVRRHLADTFAVFRIEDPAPGRWHLQVNTLEQTHVTYTAGVFVDSPLRLVIGTHPRRVKVGDIVQIGAVMLDGTTPFPLGRASASFSSPRLSLKEEIRRWRDKLKNIEPPKIDGDTLPTDLARLAVLSRRVAKGDVFARVEATHRLARAPFPWNRALPRGSGVAVPPNAPTLALSFPVTQAGSHNVTVTATGASPGGIRFVRKERVSIVAR